MSTRCGFVAIVGAPNAGKSTLLNRLTGAKLSIVSPKAQTTRFRVLGILMRGESQILLVDTPGIFKPRRRLDRAMVAAAWTGAEDADLVLFLVDARAGITDEVRVIVARLAGRGGRKWLALNKVDLLAPPKLLPLAAELTGLVAFEETFMVSAATGDGLDRLADRLAGAVPEGPHLYPDDDLTDLPDRLLAAEIVREQIFLQTHEEVPYGATVETENWQERKDGSVRVEATVYVARAGHKAILIGQGGSRIREIGARARATRATVGAAGASVSQRQGTRRLGRGDRPPARPWSGRPAMSLPPDVVEAAPQGELAIRVIAMPVNANQYGDIFGGWLMSQMDMAGGNVAMARARGRVATVAVDTMTFISPVFVGDEVSIYAHILSTGRTSMHVHLEAWRRNRHTDAMNRVTDATFVFVATDENHRPRPLPEEA